MSILTPRSRELRKKLLNLSQNSGPLHLAPAFSCLEIVDAVYRELIPRFAGSDFIISKGHGYLSQLVVLESLGRISSTSFENIGSNGALYGGHPDRGTPGIIASTGSLGHGLGMAVGLAISKSLRSRFPDSENSGLTIVLISDGELQEGSTWENVINAPALKVKNLLLIVDNNDMQTVANTSSSHPNLYPLEEKLRNFGWSVQSVDGHNHDALQEVFGGIKTDFGCSSIIAKTVKGKGVSFMESKPIWHYRSPNAEEFKDAMRELEF